MIAEPLEKGLAEDIENEVVQITWNRYDVVDRHTRGLISGLMEPVSCAFHVGFSCRFSTFLSDVITTEIILLISEPVRPIIYPHYSLCAQR